MPACGTRSKIAMACWSEDFDLDSLLSKYNFWIRGVAYPYSMQTLSTGW